MTSAVLTSRDETTWPAHMGSVPFTNRHLNSIPNPIPKKKQKKLHALAGNGVAGRFQNFVGSGHVSGSGSPVVTQTASDDAYSFNQTSASRNVSNYGEYLTFEISSFSKSELVGLRKRLSGELQQIRDLQDRIESGRFSSTGNPRSSSKIVDRRPIYSAPNSYLAAVNFGALMKDCKQIMGKLLKQKFAYIFKAPVDVVGLGLHDYYTIVKRPMDLGTVRSKLAKNLYPSPVEFAGDVRLTFNNALLYNPKNDDAYSMAAHMLGRFEEFFRPLQEKIDSFYSHQSEMDYQEFRAYDSNEGAQGNLWNNNQNQSLVASPDKAPHVPRMIERMQMPMQAHSTASTPSQQSYQPVQEQVHSPELPTFPVKDQREVGRALMKQPKPKAKDLNKREMTFEEKQKLGTGLQNLPQEKIPQFVQIIKRNGAVAQDGDEIELDIEALDIETLWELDRFVTNWKKSMSKIKRQALMDNNGIGSFGVAAPSTHIPEPDMGAISDDLAKKFKDDDEDVDIDDDMPATNFPPVEIERDEVGNGEGVNCQDHEMGNASSSSSSDSSSSSGSDSGSSSGSDSDADDAQS